MIDVRQSEDERVALTQIQKLQVSEKHAELKAKLVAVVVSD